MKSYTVDLDILSTFLKMDASGLTLNGLKIENIAQQCFH